jgi:hypothetical protein
MSKPQIVIKGDLAADVLAVLWAHAPDLAVRWDLETVQVYNDLVWTTRDVEQCLDDALEDEAPDVLQGGPDYIAQYAEIYNRIEDFVGLDYLCEKINEELRDACLNAVQSWTDEQEGKAIDAREGIA